MPTVIRESGFRFYFYSNEGNEPPHIHVEGRGGEMKVWVPSMEIEFAWNLSPRDQRQVIEIIEKNRNLILEKWNEFHSKKDK